ASEVEAMCAPLVRAVAGRPTEGGSELAAAEPARHLVPAQLAGDCEATAVDDRLRAAHERLVAPFEPLDRALLLSPDGILAGVPFHALIGGDRDLIERMEVAYCNSLLQRELLAT